MSIDIRLYIYLDWMLYPFLFIYQKRSLSYISTPNIIKYIIEYIQAIIFFKMLKYNIKHITKI